MAGIIITTTQKVINEINWYLRRRIEKEIELIKISKPRFDEFKKTADILLKTNQEADLSVLYAAVSNGGKIVTSDMALLESAEELNLSSLSCSAFLLHIIEKTRKEDIRFFMSKLYERVFRSEVSYSVKRSDFFDPVIRIQALQEQAIRVMRSHYSTQQTYQEISNTMDTPQNRSLANFLTDLEKEIVKLVNDFQIGQFKPLRREIIRSISALSEFLIQDSLSETRKIHPILIQRSYEIRARFLLLASYSSLLTKDLEMAELTLDTLITSAIQFKETLVKTELLLDAHFLRITLYLLTGDFPYLSSYFTTGFVQLCELYEREDILNLTRAAIRVQAVLSGRYVNPNAELENIKMVEFMQQVAYQLFTLGRKDDAILLFHQAAYDGITMKKYELCEVSLKNLIILHYSTNEKLTKLIEELTELVEEEFKEEKEKIRLKTEEKEKLVEKGEKIKKAEELPEHLKGWLTVVKDEVVEIKGKGKARLIRLIETKNQVRTGLIETLDIIPKKVEGSQIELNNGEYKITKATKKEREEYEIDQWIEFDSSTDIQVTTKGASGIFQISI